MIKRRNRARGCRRRCNVSKDGYESKKSRRLSRGCDERLQRGAGVWLRSARPALVPNSGRKNLLRLALRILGCFLGPDPHMPAIDPFNVEGIRLADQIDEFAMTV